MREPATGLRCGGQRPMILCVVVLLARMGRTAGILPLLDHEVVANDATSFLAALHNADKIVLSGNITLDPQKWTPTDAALLPPGRHLTITAAGSPNLTEVTGPQYDGSATVDLSSLWPVITVGGGASLQLQKVVMKGFKTPNAADVRGRPNATQPTGLLSWPSIDAQPGSQVRLMNVLYHYFSIDCSPTGILERVQSVGPLVGPGMAGVMPPPNDKTLYIHGPRRLLLPVLPLAGGPSQGDVELEYDEIVAEFVQEATFSSLPGANGSSSSTSGGGASGPGRWVWLVTAVAAVLVVVASMGAVAWRLARHSRHSRSAELQTSAAASGRESPLGEVKVASPSSDSQQSWPSAVSGLESTLRIRFGDLDQIELGELIGRGGYGRVYKARWRGAPVAVKVVEHSVRSVQSAGDAGGPAAPPALPWENVLSTALSHPNIITTYRVSTVELQRAPAGHPASCSFLGASQPSSPAALVAAGGQGQNAAARTADTAVSAKGGAGVHGAPRGTEARTEQAGRAEGRPIAEEGPLVAASASGQSLQGASAGHLENGGAVVQESFFETWMVLEYADKGSLASAIKAQRFLSRRTRRPHLRAVLLCLQDVARGMVYLHSQHIVHGDLKAGNILLKSREDGGGGFTCKIADFGQSRLLDAAQAQLLTQTCGTIGYMPPEVMAHGRLTTATDVYSFGMLMYELAACCFAFGSETAAQIFYRVLHLGERPALPEGLALPAEYVGLMQRCWAAHSADRPAFIEILRELEALTAQDMPPNL